MELERDVFLTSEPNNFNQNRVSQAVVIDRDMQTDVIRVT